MDRSYDVITFISRVANFADVVKIAITFIKTNFKDSKKNLKIRSCVLKCNLITNKTKIVMVKLFIYKQSEAFREVLTIS